MTWADEYPANEATYRKRVYVTAMIGLAAFLVLLSDVVTIKLSEMASTDSQFLGMKLIFFSSLQVFVASLLALGLLQFHRWYTTNPWLVALRARAKK